MSLLIKPRRALALIVLLSGCAAGPDFVRPEAPAITRYAMAGDESAAAPLSAAPISAHEWWKAFGSADLDRVMNEALAGNQDLAAAEATLAQTAAAESAARGGGFPQIDANAGAQREKINTTAFGFTGFPSPTINLYSVGASVGYDLDLFGLRKRRIEGATARAEAEERRTEAAYLALTGRVAQQAFEIAALRGQIDALNAVIDDDRRNVDMVRRAIEAGGAGSGANVSANAQLAEDLADLPPLKQRLSVARHQLALLVGKAPAEWAAPDFALDAFAVPATPPVSVPSVLVHNRPDILAAEADLHAATADVGVATAMLYPNLSLTAALTQTALSTSDLFASTSSGWNVGGGLAAPLFHGGTLRANKRGAQANADKALARYRQTVLTAFTQVADSLDAIGHGAEEVEARQSAVDAASANLRDAEIGFDKGGAALIAVLDAQRQRARVTRDLAAARGAQLQNLSLLYVASAADWAKPEAARASRTR